MGAPPPPPEEYEVFELCCLLGCLPEDLDRLDEADYQRFRGFLHVKKASGQLRTYQQQFYG